MAPVLNSRGGPSRMTSMRKLINQILITITIWCFDLAMEWQFPPSCVELPEGCIRYMPPMTRGPMQHMEYLRKFCLHHHEFISAPVVLKLTREKHLKKWDRVTLGMTMAPLRSRLHAKSLHVIYLLHAVDHIYTIYAFFLQVGRNPRKKPNE